MMFLVILSEFHVLWTTKERTDSSMLEIIHVSRVNDYFKCHRNITMQTYPLQMDNLITNRSVAIYKASKRILNTQCVKISLLPNVKNF